MYTHCLFCRGDLGQNQEVEHFQVGRRLAYDLRKGLHRGEDSTG